MADDGALPTFLVIGTGKGGTSSLFKHLQQHPGVWVHERKELHYFDRPADEREPLEWYRAQFAEAPPGLARGDLTPSYLARPWAAADIASVVPDARLIAILRNPVDRAYSYFQMQEAKWCSGATFEDVVRAELAGEPPPVTHARYLEEGRYATHLRRYLEHFDAEQLLVLLTEDLERDPAATYKQVLVHIGVDPTVEPSTLGGRFNETRPLRWPRVRLAMLRRDIYNRAPRTARLIDRFNELPGYGPMSDSLRAELTELFADDNADLAELLQRDLSAWGARS